MRRLAAAGEALGPGLEVVALGEAAGQTGGFEVLAAGAVVAAGQLVEVSPDGVEAVVVVQARVLVELVELCEGDVGSVGHGDGDRSVERDDRVRGDAAEHVVQRTDLEPVGVRGGRRLVVDGGDGGLQLVRTDRTVGERAGDQRRRPRR